jgi:hypothetical protein
MGDTAYIFRLRHARGSEVSVVTRDGKTFLPDHGWNRGLNWEENAPQVRAALRGEASSFVLVTAAAMTLHDHTAHLHQRRTLFAHA